MYQYDFIRFNEGFGRRQETIGERISAYRRKYNLTAVAFAKLCQMEADAVNCTTARFSCDAIRKYETGKCSPKIDKLAIIARVMQVPVATLCGYGPRRYYFSAKSAASLTTRKGLRIIA